MFYFDVLIQRVSIFYLLLLRVNPVFIYIGIESSFGNKLFVNYKTRQNETNTSVVDIIYTLFHVSKGRVGESSCIHSMMIDITK